MDFIQTGYSELDQALYGAIGVHGWEKGTINLIRGTPGSYKSHLALTTCAEVTGSRGRVVYIDSDVSFDPVRAKDTGVCMDKCVVLTISDLTRVIDTLGQLTKINPPELLILDSLLVGDPLGETRPASIWPSFLPKFGQWVRDNGVVVLATAPVRNNLQGITIGDIAWQHQSRVILHMPRPKQKGGEIVKPGGPYTFTLSETSPLPVQEILDPVLWDFPPWFG